jgi:hypothetical protein
MVIEAQRTFMIESQKLRAARLISRCTPQNFQNAVCMQKRLHVCVYFARFCRALRTFSRLARRETQIF